MFYGTAFLFTFISLNLSGVMVLTLLRQQDDIVVLV